MQAMSPRQGTFEPTYSGKASVARPMQNGCFVDRLTQRWVRFTGRRVTWDQHPWLEGPVGDVNIIGTDFFHRYASRRGWTVVEDGEPRGLLDRFSVIEGQTCRTNEVSREVVRFYERTSLFEFDVWSQWCGVFRPFGWALGVMFSRRLQQLNVPLSPLETKLGITSRVVRLVTQDGLTAATAWVREILANQRALYVGSYSTCKVPGFEGTCLKVAFPLPNGYALVIMKPESFDDGSFQLRSEGVRFGDPGFYFFVEAEPGRGWARYVRTLKESIHVFQGEDGVLRADHALRFCGVRFLRLHYRMRCDEVASGASSRDAACDPGPVTIGKLGEGAPAKFR